MFAAGGAESLEAEGALSGENGPPPACSVKRRGLSRGGNRGPLGLLEGGVLRQEGLLARGGGLVVLGGGVRLRVTDGEWLGRARRAGPGCGGEVGKVGSPEGACARGRRRRRKDGFARTSESPACWQEGKEPAEQGGRARPASPREAVHTGKEPQIPKENPRQTRRRTGRDCRGCARPLLSGPVQRVTFGQGAGGDAAAELGRVTSGCVGADLALDSVLETPGHTPAGSECHKALVVHPSTLFISKMQ